MKREDAKKMLPIIAAFANGERVQWLNGDKWEDREDWTFAGHTDSYRIAPKSEDAEWLREEAHKFEIGRYGETIKRFRAIADKLERLEGGAA